jgi:hypothetical protein
MRTAHETEVVGELKGALFAALRIWSEWPNELMSPS